MAKVKFGDVAYECRETYKGDQSGLPVVGLEHIEPETMKLSSWGTCDDNTFSKAFHNGQVLFGRRRAYLKKAVQATCDGICSGDITVIEAKSDKLLPELLPFIVQNDTFFDYAVSHSAGSLSPRVKWEHLQGFEFELPDIVEQHRLADVLWAIDEAKTAYKNLIAATDDLVKSRFVEMFGDNDFPVRQLGDVCTKITDGTHKTPNYQDSGITFISAKNIVNGKLDYSDIKHISVDEYSEIQKRCGTEIGDVLLTKSGSLGSPAIVDTDQPLGLFESLAVLKYDRRILNGTFLCEQIKGENVQRQLASGVKGIAVKHLHLNVISNTKIIVPPYEMQENFNDFVAQADKSKVAAQQALADLTAAQKALMRKYLG